MSKEIKDYTPKQLEQILKITSNISRSLKEGHTQWPGSMNANDLHAALNPSVLPSDEELWGIADQPPFPGDGDITHHGYTKRLLRTYASALENAQKHPDRIDEMLKELKERVNG